MLFLRYRPACSLRIIGFSIRDDSHWASGAKVSVFAQFNWSQSGIYHWNAHLTMQDSTSYIDSRPKPMAVHHIYSGGCLWGLPVRNSGACNHIDLLTWLESDRLLHHNSRLATRGFLTIKGTGAHLPMDTVRLAKSQ